LRLNIELVNEGEAAVRHVIPGVRHVEYWFMKRLVWFRICVDWIVDGQE